VDPPATATATGAVVAPATLVAAAAAPGIPRGPRMSGFARALLAIAVATAVFLAAAAAAEGQCDAHADPRCMDGANAAYASVGGSPPSAPAEEASGGEDGSTASAAAVNSSGNMSEGTKKEVKLDNVGLAGIAFVLMLLVAVLAWIFATIKFAWDGSLPARLALWGLLPEAYAAISVTSVIALLRLKTHASTPVIVLRNCVTDQGAKDLAEAMRLYGKQADLQAIELPHNPSLSVEGARALVSAALLEGSKLEELDLSFNPQFEGSVVAAVQPLLKPKASKISTLRLADCGLQSKHVQQLAENAASSGLRVLDLSCNEIPGAGEALCSICEAPVLEELILTCCGLQHEDLQAVAEELPYTSIKILQLGGNRIGAEGLRVLAEYLPKSSIDELGLEGNDLEAGDLSPLGAAWVKRPFSRVRLSNNKMSQQEVSAFVRTLKSIHH